MGEAITLFREYMGTGFVIILFLFAVVYLFVAEENKSRRILFVYMPVTVLIIFFNPLTSSILMGILDHEIYYRILWLLPVVTVLSYTASQLYIKMTPKMRPGFLAISAVLVAISGSLIYLNPNFSRAENLYHVPDELIEICDVLEAEDTEHESYAIFPAELLQYVRQYSGKLVLQYGREVIVDRWNNYNETYEAMESETVDEAVLTNEALKFVVIPKDKLGDNKFDAFKAIYESEHYVIFVQKFWKNFDGKFPYMEDPDGEYW